MQIGVTFPQNEIGADPGPIREYVQTVESLGYRHLVIFDHVLGADPSHRPGWVGYTHKSLFHEPFVLFGYLAALTQLELVTAVIILPQRQAVLVCQAGCGGRCVEWWQITPGGGRGLESGGI